MRSPFSSIEKSAWGGLLDVYGYMDRLIEVDLQTRFNISHVEFEILLRLFWTKERRLRLQELTAKSILTRTGVSRAVGRLERSGLLKRESAEEDRRGAYACLTPEGEALFRSAMVSHVALVRREFLSVFTESQLVDLGNLLTAVKMRNEPKSS